MSKTCPALLAARTKSETKSKQKSAEERRTYAQTAKVRATNQSTTEDLIRRIINFTTDLVTVAKTTAPEQISDRAFLLANVHLNVDHRPDAIDEAIKIAHSKSNQDRSIDTVSTCIITLSEAAKTMLDTHKLYDRTTEDQEPEAAASRSEEEPPMDAD